MGTQSASALVAATAVLALFTASGCRTTAGTETSQVADFQDPIQTTLIDRYFRNGDTYTMPLVPGRAIDQITVMWNGRYAIPRYDQNGNVMLNDEGKPYFKDGMYADAWVSGDAGDRQVARRKFVDRMETDNWHGLNGTRGSTLTVRFYHDPAFAGDPQVRAAGTTVSLHKVIVKYADDPNLQYQEFMYNPNPDDLLSTSAVRVQPGGAYAVKVPPGKRVYRVDVRWGDAKPRVNGVYVAGTASGNISVNGTLQGQWRNVAAIETQVWGNLNFTPSPSGQEVRVSFRNDQGRIHWIRVYYR